MFDFDGDGFADTQTDEQCYYVKDIAQYIKSKFGHLGVVPLSEIYADLDVHPIFPSDGYKNDIKKELRRFGVKITKGNVIFSGDSN